MTTALNQIRQSEKLTLTRSEVADVLGVNIRTLSNGIADGTIPSIRIGRRVVIPRDRFLAMFEVPAQEA